jgi:hypothetical protein
MPLAMRPPHQPLQHRAREDNLQDQLRLVKACPRGS